MDKIYDKNGVEIPHEEFAILAFRAMQKMRDEHNDKLVKQVKNFMNRQNKFSEEEVKMLIGVVRNHDKSYPFGG